MEEVLAAGVAVWNLSVLFALGSLCYSLLATYRVLREGRGYIENVILISFLAIINFVFTITPYYKASYSVIENQTIVENKSVYVVLYPPEYAAYNSVALVTELLLALAI
ncbi:MAG: hypothetical protein DRP09_17525, partial [Candidatus Thorarchaeota archaeon]